MAHKVHIMTLGNTLNSHRTFMERLMFSSSICEVEYVDDCDSIFAFVPIVSRAGTDIEAALQKIPANRPVVLVVLHHTYDQYSVVPDSRPSVKRRVVVTVDCLHHEDRGLLTCQRNDEALRAVTQYLAERSPPILNPGQSDPWGRPRTPSSGPRPGNPRPSPFLMPYLSQRWLDIIGWAFALLTMILVYSLTSLEYFHFTWFVPWLQLLLAVVLERTGYGKWTTLFIFIVNFSVLLFSLISPKDKNTEAFTPSNTVDMRATDSSAFKG